MRYNPHAFTIDGRKARVMRKDREARLVEVIRGAGSRDFEGLQIQYLCYNAIDGGNKIWADEGYPAELRACCLPPIIMGGQHAVSKALIVNR